MYQLIIIQATFVLISPSSSSIQLYLHGRKQHQHLNSLSTALLPNASTHNALSSHLPSGAEDGDTLSWLELAAVPVLCIYHRKYTNLILAILYYEHQEKSDQAFYCTISFNSAGPVTHYCQAEILFSTLSEFRCDKARNSAVQRRRLQDFTMLRL